MMRRMARLAVIMGVLMMAGNALAVPANKTLNWDASEGKVTFDGKIHADKGLKCGDCHTKIFKMKKGTAVMKMEAINSGKFCGECHNGTKAFKAQEKDNCKKCHQK